MSEQTQPSRDVSRKQDRTTTVVDRDIQYGIVRKIAQHWLLLFFCNVLALMVWVRLFEQPEISWSETAMECIRRFLPVFIVTVCLLPAFVLDTLKLTNRFAGPITRLRHEFAKAANGVAVQPISFRSSDYCSEIADSYNRLIRRAGLQAPDPAHQSDPRGAS